MGQLFSNTNNNEDHGDLDFNFTAYFKKIKKENKIISQETICSIELYLAKGDIQGANSVISDALKTIDSAPINIAVTGESGTGKSSFINALRGVKHEEEGAAEVGVIETTMKITSYKHPRIKNLNIWDLPGVGTLKFPPKNYLKRVEFQKYDFFIIVSAARFTKLELDLAKTIRLMKKNYYFVRTKVDFDLYNEKKCKPHTFDREKILQQIRSSYVNTFRDNKMDTPQIFLISNHSLSDYDFPVLMDTLTDDLSNQKRHNFVLSLPNITEAAIQRKYDILEQFILLQSSMFGWFSFLNVLGNDCDMENLVASLNHYRVLFGVDDVSLEVIAKDSQVPVEQLKKIIQSPYLLENKNEETLEEKLSKYLEKLSSTTGGLLGTGLYFRKSFYFQLLFLDTVTEDAKVLLRETFKKLVQAQPVHSH
ncbi:interferon-inducible GTPase 1 [Mesocricetus auratus]|uniref:Interferon-inducible GTPase 1 n=1 Tax=Mesocricetus auratus TaxID=10036 RepID=A0A1U7QAL4_MESAU|nr:interferon-inducible GTPase 1 [Mesocricetus auratus]